MLWNACFGFHRKMRTGIRSKLSNKSLILTVCQLFPFQFTLFVTGFCNLALDSAVNCFFFVAGFHCFSKTAESSNKKISERHKIKSLKQIR